MVNIKYSNLQNKISISIIAILCLLSIFLITEIFHINSTNQVNFILDSNHFGFFWNLISQTASSKLFIIPLAIIFFYVFFLIKTPLSSKKCLFINFIFLLFIAFVVKFGLKIITHEPRPFTSVLTKLNLLSKPTEFYKLTKTDKKKIISEAKHKVNKYKLKNWKKEMNYSFPSGHTIFAMIFLLYWGSFFLRERKYLSFFILAIWTLSVSYSRLWLGMHRPIDIYGSIILAYFICLLIPNLTLGASKHQK